METWRVLCSLEEIRKHALKWVYREEWALSIIESHPEGAERDSLLAMFWNEVGVIARALRPLLPALERISTATEARFPGDMHLKWL